MSVIGNNMSAWANHNLKSDAAAQYASDFYKPVEEKRYGKVKGQTRKDEKEIKND
jgi:hypothetical protein